jgi:hypothetical protein
MWDRSASESSQSAKVPCDQFVYAIGEVGPSGAARLLLGTAKRRRAGERVFVLSALCAAIGGVRGAFTSSNSSSCVTLVSANCTERTRERENMDVARGTHFLERTQVGDRLGFLLWIVLWRLGRRIAILLWCCRRRGHGLVCLGCVKLSKIFEKLPRGRHASARRA